jgi:stage II sporulation protein D
MSNERNENMRRFLCLTLIIAIFTVSAPLIALPDSDGPLIDIENTTEKKEKTTEEKKEEKDEKTVKVFSSTDNAVSTVEEKEYIIGCVAGEMPVTYDEEALKAQAVACYTFLKWKQKHSDNEKADIESSQNDQVYMTKEEMQKKWGGDYEKYRKKLTDAVNSIYGETITYENEPIMAVFHALSSGKTEDAKNVWGKEIPYLKSVSSEGDKLSPAFSTTLVLSDDEFKKLFEEKSDVDFSKNAENPIKITDRTDAGTVRKITVFDKEFTGEQIRNVLSLKSSAFTVKHTDGSFIFTVSGYGHFVGMSQYGADYMAKQGFKYDEILKHYYTGVKIS